MENFTIAEFREICNRKGIKYTTRTTKSEFIAKLEVEKPVAVITAKPLIGEY
jgi:hypothetical protein